jgi:hypothetical protein
MTRRLLGGLVFLTFTLVVSVLLGEVAVRVLGISDRILTDALYYNGYDAEVHRASALPGLLYELAPEASLSSHQGYEEHSPVAADMEEGDLEPDGSRRYTSEISEHGTRGPTFEEPKGKSVFRVLFFGASTLYGAGMNNDETMAAYLQEARHSRP